MYLPIKFKTQCHADLTSALQLEWIKDGIEYTNSQLCLVRQGRHPNTAVLKRNIRSSSTSTDPIFTQKLSVAQQPFCFQLL